MLTSGCYMVRTRRNAKGTMVPKTEISGFGGHVRNVSYGDLVGALQ